MHTVFAFFVEFATLSPELVFDIDELVHEGVTEWESALGAMLITAQFLALAVQHRAGLGIVGFNKLGSKLGGITLFLHEGNERSSVGHTRSLGAGKNTEAESFQH